MVWLPTYVLPTVVLCADTISCRAESCAKRIPWCCTVAAAHFVQTGRLVSCRLQVGPDTNLEGISIFQTSMESKRATVADK
jgi:hypothetical protein